MSSLSLLQGKSILLRPFEPEDVTSLHAILNHSDLIGRRYLPWGFPDNLPLSREQSEAVYKKWKGEEKSLALAMTSREHEELVGYAGCEWHWDPHCPSLYVVISPDRHRLGYGSEALWLLLQHLFENTPAHNISCWIDEWNLAAVNFVARHGFKESGRSRYAGMRHGAPYDSLLFDILRPEWLAKESEAGYGVRG
jgi:RimJ/RimL family protein N-acetyltransferase